MQEADATVETFDPSIPYLSLKELAVLGFLTLLALFFVPPVQAETASSVTPEQFRAWFDAARQDRLEIPDEVGRNARRYRYVFIGGLFNEQMPGYFLQNVKELRARGVPRTSSTSSSQVRSRRLMETPNRFAPSCWRSPRRDTSGWS